MRLLSASVRGRPQLRAVQLGDEVLHLAPDSPPQRAGQLKLCLRVFHARFVRPKAKKRARFVRTRNFAAKIFHDPSCLLHHGGVGGGELAPADVNRVLQSDPDMSACQI